MRTERQHLIDRAVIRALLQAGRYLLPERTLQQQLEVAAPVVPAPTAAEIESAIRHLQTEGRIVVVVSEETGSRKLQISDGGRAWAALEGIG